MECMFRSWHKANSKKYRKANPNAPKKKRFEYQRTAVMLMITNKLFDLFQKYPDGFMFSYDQIVIDLKNQLGIELSPRTLRRYFTEFRHENLITTEVTGSKNIIIKCNNLNDFRSFIENLDTLLQENMPNYLKNPIPMYA